MGAAPNHMEKVVRLAIAASAILLLGGLPTMAASLTGLAINVKNSSKNAIFIYWDNTGRCGANAKCKPFAGMKDPKNGLYIQPGAIFSFGADDQSVQIGDSTTAHIFSAYKGKLPSVESSTKTFPPIDTSVDKDVAKSGVVTLNWTGTDLKKE